MKQTDRVKYCNSCKKQAYSPEEGTICGLTGKRADFNEPCVNFDDDGTFIKKRSQYNFWAILFFICTVFIFFTSAGKIFSFDFSKFSVWSLYGIAYFAFRAIIAAFVLFALPTKNNKAVYWSIALIATTLLGNLVVVLNSLTGGDVISALIDIIPSTAIHVAWICYFIRSEYIQDTFKPQEANYKKDKILLYIILIILLVLKFVPNVIS